MSNNIKKDDLRIKKTHMALISAMLDMLTSNDFNKMTVNDLCCRAGVSRATFYVHFNDKYDLLGFWLRNVRKDLIQDIFDTSEISSSVNQFVSSNKKVITNIIKNADNEVLDIIQEFMASFIYVSIKKRVNTVSGRNHVILTNFCIGGLVNLLVWQVKNNFPPENQMMNDYLYNMIGILIDWSVVQPEPKINGKNL